MKTEEFRKEADKALLDYKSNVQLSDYQKYVKLIEALYGAIRRTIIENHPSIPAPNSKGEYESQLRYKKDYLIDTETERASTHPFISWLYQIVN